SSASRRTSPPRSRLSSGAKSASRTSAAGAGAGAAEYDRLFGGSGLSGASDDGQPALHAGPAEDLGRSADGPPGVRSRPRYGQSHRRRGQDGRDPWGGALP